MYQQAWRRAAYQQHQSMVAARKTCQHGMCGYLRDVLNRVLPDLRHVFIIRHCNQYLQHQKLNMAHQRAL